MHHGFLLSLSDSRFPWNISHSEKGLAMARTKRDDIRARNAKLWDEMFGSFTVEARRMGLTGHNWTLAYRTMCDEYELKREKYPTYQFHIRSDVRQSLRKNMNRKDRQQARAALKAGRYDDLPKQQSGRSRVIWEAM